MLARVPCPARQVSPSVAASASIKLLTMRTVVDVGLPVKLESAVSLVSVRLAVPQGTPNVAPSVWIQTPTPTTVEVVGLFVRLDKSARVEPVSQTVAQT